MTLVLEPCELAAVRRRRQPQTCFHRVPIASPLPCPTTACGDQLVRINNDEPQLQRGWHARVTGTPRLQRRARNQQGTTSSATKRKQRAEPISMLTDAVLPGAWMRGPCPTISHSRASCSCVTTPSWMSERGITKRLSPTRLTLPIHLRACEKPEVETTRHRHR